MIDIKVNETDDKVENKTIVHIKGFDNAVNQFRSVFRGLWDSDKDVFLEALSILQL